MRGVKRILCLVALVLLSACASEKVPAEQAIKAAETAVAGVKAEAAKWVPDQAQALDASLASLKDKFAKGDYKAVLAEAPGIASRASPSATMPSSKRILPRSISR